MMTHLFLSVLEISMSVSLIVLALLVAAPLLNKRILVIADTFAVTL